MATAADAPTGPSGRGRRRWIVLGIVPVGLIVIVLAALVATRYYPAYRSALAARDDLREAQAILRDSRLDAGPSDLTAVEARLEDAEEGFRSARQAFQDPLASAMGHVPLLGDSLEATADLAEIGIEGARLGQESIATTRTYQRLRDREQGTLTERVDEILSEMEPSMTAVKERLARLHAMRDEMAGATLPPPLAGAVRQLDDDLAELDELVGTYDDLSAFLPEFLGFEGPRTYLVLAQNNAELLPTGGLISVYGVISVREGRVEEQVFEDAVSFGGRWLEKTDTYIEPPAPLKRYLLRDFSWNLAVSNWSPHFPTAGQEAERFFRLAGGQPVDGVIAVNVHTIEELLGVTGPITIDSYGVTLTPENALDVIEEHTRTAQEPEGDRKAFVGLLAEELLSELVRTPPERWADLVESVERLRAERQTLFFAHDGKQQVFAGRLGLDGALVDTEGDYLMLVDASVNSTKLNVALEERIDLAVRLDAQGYAHHRATVSYHNDLPAWSKGRDPLLVRRLMLSGLYGGYVRLLAPARSWLTGIALAGREVGPEEIGMEEGKASFGRFFALPSGEATELVFEYVTPGAARREDDLLVYRLYLQKQSGTDAIPLRLDLALPDGARLHSFELDGEALPSLAALETDLSQDRELVVRYELER